jgi:superfamily II DNA or RNA helicase
LDGFATTYQAVGLDEGTLEQEFERYRYILICDEFHHIQENSLWHKKIDPLFEKAAFRVMLSGTLERGDGSRIAFLPYRQNGCGMVPDLQERADTAVVRYTRADALRERAIIPLSFHLSDGRTEWEKGGRKVTIDSMEKMDKGDAAKAIYTALHTEFADELLESGLAHWQGHRRLIPGAKCLVVTSNIEQARRHTKALKERGLRVRFDIATSSDSEQALRAIKKMKQDKLDLLVTVAMAYEGLDVPAISHAICLTRIRSGPWIEQMTARTNRIDPNGGPYEQQFGYIFAPADPLFRDIVSRIEAEQLAVIEERKTGKREREQSESDGVLGGLFGPLAPGGIKPLSSAMTGRREVILNGNGTAPEMTSSEIEASLLEEIDDHLRKFAYDNRYELRKLNSQVYDFFGKPRRQMTIGELRNCLAHVRSVYPRNQIRGTGNKRVPSKAQPINVQWK